MVFTDDLINALTKLVRSSEAMQEQINDIDELDEEIEEALGNLESDTNYARGVLLAAGRPFKG